MNIYGMIFIVVFLGLAAGVAVLLLRLTGKEVRTEAQHHPAKRIRWVARAIGQLMVVFVLSPYLVAGVLFLRSWQLSKKTP